MSRELHEIYSSRGKTSSPNMYPSQTVSDKQRIIERCKQTIAEMRTNIQNEKSKPHNIQNQKYIERCENIIRNQSETIAREEEALEIFEKASRKIRGAIQKQNEIAKSLSNNNQR